MSTNSVSNTGAYLVSLWLWSAWRRLLLLRCAGIAERYPSKPLAALNSIHGLCC